MTGAERIRNPADRKRAEDAIDEKHRDKLRNHTVVLRSQAYNEGRTDAMMLRATADIAEALARLLER